MAQKRGLDGRARDEDGRIREKRGDTLAKTLAKTYPEFEKVKPDTRLDQLRDRFGVDSLREVREQMRKK